jgi:hypothetical protein
MSTPVTNLVRRCSRCGGVKPAASRETYAWAARRKPPVPQAGSTTPVVDRRLDDLDHRLDESPRSEVLAGGRLGVPGAPFEQFLVGVTVDIGAGR